MNFISYAQNFEDVILWRVFKNIKNGYYIDIGSENPIVDSVSYTFSQNAWKGLSIEPTQQYFEHFKQIRPHDHIIQAFVSDEKSTVPFYIIEDTGLSTASLEIAEHHRLTGLNYSVKEIETITLEDVWKLAGHQDIHWLKIDVEGYEKKILQGWNDDTRPWVLVLESFLPRTRIPTHQEWESLLLNKGYQFVYADGLNRFYLHENHSDLKSLFQYPPNVEEDSLATWRVITAEKQVLTLNTHLSEQEIKFKTLLENLTSELIQAKSQLSAQEIQFIAQLENLTNELARAKSQLSEQKIQYQKITQELHMVYNSKSWFLTRPLRVMNLIYKTSTRTLLIYFATYLNRYPKLRKIAVNHVDKFPKISIKLRASLNEDRFQIPNTLPVPKILFNNVSLKKNKFDAKKIESILHDIKDDFLIKNIDLCNSNQLNDYITRQIKLLKEKVQR